MTASERAVLRMFRSYRMEPNQILCLHAGFAKPHPRAFATAVRSLVEQDLLVKERWRHAYSLTPSGYSASLQCLTIDRVGQTN
jgi:hypothetical protein